MTSKVDLSKIKVGDTVLIEAVVDTITEQAGLKVFPPGYAEKALWVESEGIRDHIPKPIVWKAGDKYKIGERGPWTILFIDENSVYQQYLDSGADRYSHSRAAFDRWDKEKVE